MIANFHTHTTFCDGKNTPEEVVLSAIQKGFSDIGFSGHGYTDFDLTYCIKDMDAYIREINRLKEKYKNEIQVYTGIEEDAFCPVDRAKFDYILGSSHYLYVDEKYYPIDCGYDGFKKCLELFRYDVVALAESYYSAFCEYIQRRKPDIIGHFDLITKYEEMDDPLFLQNEKYNAVAEKYVAEAAKSGCVFELNTGAIARGLRTSPYPSENLLHILKELDADIILSSDSHQADTVDFYFEEAKKYIKDIGFTRLVTLQDGKFIKYDI